jgi:hypothetical protein
MNAPGVETLTWTLPGSTLAKHAPLLRLALWLESGSSQAAVTAPA